MPSDPNNPNSRRNNGGKAEERIKRRLKIADREEKDQAAAGQSTGEPKLNLPQEAARSTIEGRDTSTPQLSAKRPAKTLMADTPPSDTKKTENNETLKGNEIAKEELLTQYQEQFGEVPAQEVKPFSEALDYLESRASKKEQPLSEYLDKRANYFGFEGTQSEKHLNVLQVEINYSKAINYNENRNPDQPEAITSRRELAKQIKSNQENSKGEKPKTDQPPSPLTEEKKRHAGAARRTDSDNKALGDKMDEAALEAQEKAKLDPINYYDDDTDSTRAVKDGSAHYDILNELGPEGLAAVKRAARDIKGGSGTKESANKVLGDKIDESALEAQKKARRDPIIYCGDTDSTGAVKDGSVHYDILNELGPEGLAAVKRAARDIKGGPGTNVVVQAPPGLNGRQEDLGDSQPTVPPRPGRDMF